MTNKKAVVIVTAFLFYMFLAPFAIIWGWNQLFGEELHMIAYTFWNWLGLLALSLMFNTNFFSRINQ